eukprot:scaffold111213_cov54-Phaeocystis_antarctica.AAC.1
MPKDGAGSAAGCRKILQIRLQDAEQQYATDEGSPYTVLCTPAVHLSSSRSSVSAAATWVRPSSIRSSSPSSSALKCGQKLARLTSCSRRRRRRHGSAARHPPQRPRRASSASSAGRSAAGSASCGGASLARRDAARRAAATCGSGASERSTTR